MPDVPGRGLLGRGLSDRLGVGDGTRRVGRGLSCGSGPGEEGGSVLGPVGLAGVCFQKDMESDVRD